MKKESTVEEILMSSVVGDLQSRRRALLSSIEEARGEDEKETYRVELWGVEERLAALSGEVSA